jgi:serine carboxypeptidase-like clade 2
MNSNASFWIYPILIRENLRVWVYSGDVDANVPITGTLMWLLRLKEDHGIPVIEPWREWWVPGLHAHENQMGGMTWQLRGLTFATIKGAGHMAPKDKRKEGFVLVDSFLNGVPLPEKGEDEVK